MNKKTVIKKRDLLYILVSALLYAVSIRWFVEPNNLLPAGFSGLSQLLALLLVRFLDIHVPFMLLYLVLQSVTALLVIRFIGKRFALLSVLQFTLSTVFSQLLPQVYLTDDQLLLTLFGGIICGFATIFALAAEASTGGTDFIAIYLLNKKNAPVFNHIMYANFIILGLSGALVSWQLMLYSMVFQFVTTMIINNISKVNKLKQLLVITCKADEIIVAFHAMNRHGITQIASYGTYSKTNNFILLTVVNEYEVRDIIELMKRIDRQVFISISPCEQTVGRFSIKKIQ